MSDSIQAIYEHGVLRPLEPLALAEGEQIEIVLLKRKHHKAAQILSEIAALPLEGEQDNFSGQDHDRILYPMK